MVKSTASAASVPGDVSAITAPLTRATRAVANTTANVVAASASKASSLVRKPTSLFSLPNLFVGLLCVVVVAILVYAISSILRPSKSPSSLPPLPTQTTRKRPMNPYTRLQKLKRIQAKQMYRLQLLQTKVTTQKLINKQIDTQVQTLMEQLGANNNNANNQPGNNQPGNNQPGNNNAGNKGSGGDSSSGGDGSNGGGMGGMGGGSAGSGGGMESFISISSSTIKQKAQQAQLLQQQAPATAQQQAPATAQQQAQQQALQQALATAQQQAPATAQQQAPATAQQPAQQQALATTSSDSTANEGDGTTIPTEAQANLCCPDVDEQTALALSEDKWRQFMSEYVDAGSKPNASLTYLKKSRQGCPLKNGGCFQHGGSAAAAASELPSMEESWNTLNKTASASYYNIPFPNVNYPLKCFNTASTTQPLLCKMYTINSNDAE